MASRSRRTSLARSRLLYRGSRHSDTFCSVLPFVLLGAVYLLATARLHVTYSRIATMPKPSKKTTKTPDTTPAKPVTLNEALVTEYPDDFVVQYVFAPAAKTPRRMLRYELQYAPHRSLCKLTRRQSHTCDRHGDHRVPSDL